MSTAKPISRAKELRTFLAQELRAEGNDSGPKITGYAATFGTVTNIGKFNEVIQRGAFKRSIAEGDDVVALIDHNPSMILGRRSAGTLKLEEDDKGLRFSCTLPDTSIARDAYANLKAGNLRECSFGFYVDNEDGEDWAQQADGTMLRTLKSVRLFDVSVVTFPAYGNTSAAARNVVSEHVEARMKSMSAEQGTATRRARAEALLAEHQEWLKAQVQANAEAEVEHNRRRLQLGLAKLL
jgi:HK97 family phage prohead protease